jgi:hypothetical protein
VSGLARGKKRSKKPPLRLTDADVREIDELIEAKRRQGEWPPRREPDAAKAPAAKEALALLYKSQRWSKTDPGWQFVWSHPSSDRFQVIDDLLDSDIPMGRHARGFVKDVLRELRDPNRRERDGDRGLPFAVAIEVDIVADLLKANGFEDAKTRAEEYLARQLREAVKRDRKHARFSSGPALNTWVRWALKKR